MATRTWSSAASTDLNLAANYSGTGDLLTTDDLVFDATSVIDAVATANLSVNSITVAATYSGNMSFSGYTITCSNGNASFDGTGTLNIGNAVTLNGASATFHIGSGVGTLTTTSCAVTMNGTTGMTMDIDKATTFKTLTIGASAKITNGGAGNLKFSHTSTPLSMGASSSLTNNAELHIGLSGSSSFVSLGSGYTISGSGSIRLDVDANSISATIPSITTTNHQLFILDGSASKTGWTVQFTGTINIGTASLYILILYANSSGTIDFNGQSVVCGSFICGCYVASATLVVNYTASTIAITSYVGSTYNVGSCTENFQTSQWSCSGNWTFGSNHTINRGTSSVTITNTSTITSSSKTFGNFTINAATKTITIADALSVLNYTKTIGTQSGNFSTTCAGDALFSVSTTLYRLIMTKATTRSVTVLAGGTLTLSNLTDTNLNGSAGALTQWRSTTHGTAFNLAIPGIVTLTYQNPQDCSSNEVITVNDGTSVNWGNNTNWTFPTATSSSRRPYSIRALRGD